MTAPWFSSDVAPWFAAVGLIGLTALATPLIVKGRRPKFIIGLWLTIIMSGLVCLLAGVAAVFTEQPDHVKWPLLVTGLAVALGYSFSLIFVLRAYRLAEARKVAAHEL